MRIDKYFSSATAVTISPNGDYFLAIKGSIVLFKKDGTMQDVLKIRNRILDLKCIDSIIYGAGDSGVFIRSNNSGKTWSIDYMPTKASIWSVSANKKGVVVIHGNNVLFLSKDFGRSWTLIKPFESLQYDKPAIRSLFLDNTKVYIGTKIHQNYGGVWRLDLERNKLSRIKKSKRMTASILKFNEYIITASGSCKGKKGTIEYGKETLNKGIWRWKKCVSDYPASCYLDLSESEGFLYTSTAQDENGEGAISRILLKENRITQCGFIKGHGWRVSNLRNEYAVAGLNESIISKW